MARKAKINTPKVNPNAGIFQSEDGKYFYTKGRKFTHPNFLHKTFDFKFDDNKTYIFKSKSIWATSMSEATMEMKMAKLKGVTSASWDGRWLVIKFITEKK